MVSTKEVNFGCLQRLLKKAMREVLVVLFPTRNSFILDLTVHGEETATFGLLELLRDVVSERSSERKKLLDFFCFNPFLSSMDIFLPGSFFLASVFAFQVINKEAYLLRSIPFGLVVVQTGFPTGPLFWNLVGELISRLSLAFLFFSDEFFSAFSFSFFEVFAFPSLLERGWEGPADKLGVVFGGTISFFIFSGPNFGIGAGGSSRSSETSM